MLRKITILAACLSLAACNATAESNRMPVVSPSDVNSNSSTVKTPSEVALPESQCQGEVPSSIKAKLGEYRLAQPSDFVAAIRTYQQENPRRKLTCSIFTVDFNEDGLKDYALLLVNPKTRDFRFAIAMNRDNGKFEPAVVKNFHRLANSDGGIVYTSMIFKPSGALGAAKREYSPLKYGTTDQEIFKAKPAIEVWKAIATTPGGVPQDLNVSTLAYCSDVFYFVDGQLKNFSVCD